MMGPWVAFFLFPGVIWAGASETDAELAQAAKLLQEARLATAGPELVAYFRKLTPSEARQTELAAAVRALGSKSFRARERATAELTAAGRSALSFLQPALNDADAEIARRARTCIQRIEQASELPLVLAAGKLLAARKPSGATAALLDYLPFVSDEAVEHELRLALAEVAFADGTARPELVAALKDSSPTRRAAAGLLLGRSRKTDLMRAARPLLTDPEARVRLSAAQGLIASGEKHAVPVLIALLGEGPLPVAWQAEELLYRIARDQSPGLSVGNGEKAERGKCREAWARWWSEHEAKIDFAKLDLEQRTLGWTMLVSYDGYDAGKRRGGRVWEMGANRQALWEIRNVNGPIDAQLLPGKRVLVAEYGSGRVTERDLTGKVLWEHAISGPVACQRLPNGNTLLANNSEIVEVTPQQKRVFTLAAKHGLIFSAQKLRDGHLVYVTFAGVLVELDAAGKEIAHINFAAPNDGKITVEVLPGGRYLIPLTMRDKVVEMDRSGKVLWECAVSKPNSATRLPNGNLLVCSRQDCRVVELSRSGRIIWELRQQGHLFRVHRR
jgi:hypothetical protein